MLLSIFSFVRLSEESDPDTALLRRLTDVGLAVSNDPIPAMVQKRKSLRQAELSLLLHGGATGEVRPVPWLSDCRSAKLVRCHCLSSWMFDF